MHAVFFDGKTSASREIDFTIVDKTIIGKVKDGTEVFNWSLQSLKLLQIQSGNRPAIICNADSDTEARIYIKDSNVYQSLSKELNNFRSIKKDIIVGWKALMLMGIVVVCFVLIPFWIVPTFSGEILKITPLFITNNIGKYVMNSYLKKYKMIESGNNKVIYTIA